jgi:hypothetical protein
MRPAAMQIICTKRWELQQMCIQVVEEGQTILQTVQQIVSGHKRVQTGSGLPAIVCIAARIHMYMACAVGTALLSMQCVIVAQTRVTPQQVVIARL